MVLGLGSGRIVPGWDAVQKIFLPVTDTQLTLSFDQRVLDGGAAGRLLARIEALLQTPESL
jgi:pyruvate/2-oxoglutarate dehydrogenase complex dihydrolipoamide acyltransferase (E2) component